VPGRAHPFAVSLLPVLVSFGAFAVAATLIVLLPGPDTLVVVRSLVRGGRTLGVRTVAGVLTGLTIWAGSAALGLSALLQASHDGYLALRIAGGVYLVWLGIQSWRSSRAPDSASDAADSGSDTGAGSRGRAGYTAGLLTDLLNPKVGVFFVTFLPGFVPHGSPVLAVTLALGALFVVLTAAYFAVLLVAAGRVQALMSHRRVRRRMERATATVLVGFGVRLLIE
jgi:threonine/homoserine/homoserine lactone efflux protein